MTTKHRPNPVANPFNAAAIVCSDCGAPLAKVNTGAAKVGYKHYVTTASYKATVLATLAGEIN